jgi:hypothetical protein
VKCAKKKSESITHIWVTAVGEESFIFHRQFFQRLETFADDDFCSLKYAHICKTPQEVSDGVMGNFF